MTDEQNKAVDGARKAFSLLDFSDAKRMDAPLCKLTELLSQTQSALEQAQARIANLEHDAKLPRLQKAREALKETK